MLLKRKDKIGPHVIEPTDEKIKLYHNGKCVGRFHEWRCKYCGLQAIHPKHCDINLRWKTDFRLVGRQIQKRGQRRTRGIV